ncbi:hypothetical protein CPB86DRAFT_791279 [Serendipita vermifera]|nr:hypothetical protein CPB86DRAFT_791279 [Serendipita vermifera]
MLNNHLLFAHQEDFLAVAKPVRYDRVRSEHIDPILFIVRLHQPVVVPPLGG